MQKCGIGVISMLIEFRVSNFRSFRSEARLSAVASADKSHSENLMDTGIRALPYLLTSIGIYGANASGKSNFVRALQIMRAIVVQSAGLQQGQRFNVQPFLFDAELKGRPCEFEVTFVREGIRYQYGFTATPERIEDEWLLVYQKSQPQNWFNRTWIKQSGKYVYKFGTHFQGARRVWEDATRENALFLSTAIQLNSEQLRPVFEWFNRSLVVFENGGGPPPNFTIDHIRKNESRSVREFMSAADISIDNIRIIPQKGVQRTMQFDLATGVFNQSAEAEVELFVPEFVHSTKEGAATFPLQDESEGTQKLFSLAGPLFEILRDGHILVVDELDRSLHTLLVRKLIALFSDRAMNSGGAQLIFTTHDASLFDADLLRRDQFWFTEKDNDQASVMYPLTKFSPRKEQALERGYLAGRFGAVPLLRASGH